MTKQEWAVIAKVLADFYPHNFKLADAGAVGNWFKALADLPGDRVAAAVWSMVRSQPAFPSVADIRRLAEGAADAPAEAWLAALKMAEQGCAPEHMLYVPAGKPREGYTQTVDPADPVLAKTIAAIGGLRVIGLCELSRLETLRAQFLKMYQGFAAEARRRQTFAALGVASEPLSLLDGPKSDRPTTLVEVIKSIVPAAPSAPPDDQEDPNP